MVRKSFLKEEYIKVRNTRGIEKYQMIKGRIRKIYACFAKRTSKERNKRSSARRKLNYVSEHSQREQEVANSLPRTPLQKEPSTSEKKKKEAKGGCRRFQREEKTCIFGKSRRKHNT